MKKPLPKAVTATRAPAAAPAGDPLLLQMAAADAAVSGVAPPAPAGADPVPQDESKAEKLEALAGENRDLLNMALSLLDPLAPFLRQCYTAEKVEQIAVAAAAVENKYGISIADLFVKWKEEMALAIALVPPSIQAFTMTRAFIAERKAEAQREAAKPAPAAAPVAPLAAEGPASGAT